MAIVTFEQGLTNVGINLQFYEADSYDHFKGIKDIPEGTYLLHVTDPSANVRYGLFIDLRQEDQLCLRRHGDELMVEDAKVVEYPLLASYQPREGIDEDELFDGIQWRRYCSGALSSQDSTPLETFKLNEALKKSARNSTREEIQSGVDELAQLRLTQFDPTDKRTFVRDPAAPVQMHSYLDRAWLVQKLFADDPTRESNAVVGSTGFNSGQTGHPMSAIHRAGLWLYDEFRFTFLVAAILNNYGAYIQWKALLDLFLRSVSLCKECPEVGRRFVQSLLQQLTVISQLRTGEDDFQLEISDIEPSFQDLLLNLDQVDDFALVASYNNLVSRLNECFDMDLSTDLEQAT